MNRKYGWVALYLIVASFVLTIASDADAQSSARRKRKKAAAKVSTPVKNSPSVKPTTSSYDMGVEVKSTPFGKVIVLTNREKTTITIHKIVVNDEWEVKGSDLLHSTKSWTSLPVELKLGDELRASLYSYDRAPIYIDLDTDKGKFTFKVNK